MERLQTLPLVSFVIPTYDFRRLDDVRDLLESLKSQSYINIEVILVTEVATIGSEIKKHIEKGEFMNTRILVDTRLRGVNGCRNLGVINARGDFISLIDDDVVLDKNWVRNVIATFFRISNVGAITGPARPLWVGKPADWIPMQMHWLISCTVWDWAAIVQIRNVGGMNSCFERTALLQTSLFDASIGPMNGGAKSGKVLYVGAEEIELCRQLRHNGKLVLYDPSVSVQHKVYEYQTTWKSLTKRAVHFGYTRGYVSRCLSERQGSALAFEIVHLKSVILSVLPGIGESGLGLADRFRRFLLYPVSMIALLLGYVCYLVFAGSDK